MAKKRDSGTMKAVSKDSVAAARKAYEEASEEDLEAGAAYRKARAEGDVSAELLETVNEIGRKKADALQVLNEAEAAAAAKKAEDVAEK